MTCKPVCYIYYKKRTVKLFQGLPWNTAVSDNNEKLFDDDYDYHYMYDLVPIENIQHFIETYTKNPTLFERALPSIVFDFKNNLYVTVEVDLDENGVRSVPIIQTKMLVPDEYIGSRYDIKFSFYILTDTTYQLWFNNEPIPGTVINTTLKKVNIISIIPINIKKTDRYLPIKLEWTL
jgi:hypothetical protein